MLKRSIFLIGELKIMLTATAARTCRCTTAKITDSARSPDTMSKSSLGTSTLS